QLTNHLEHTFGPLSKTLFFEYHNLQALSAYFVTAHGTTLAEMFRTIEDVPVSIAPVLDERSTLLGTSPQRGEARRGEGQGQEGTGGRARPRSAPHPTSPRWGEESETVSRDYLIGPLDIAIIGLAGRYPGANTMAQFWRNLCDGKDCISTIPQDRFDGATG